VTADDVSEPSYDDVELSLARQMADEQYDDTDDEAMLEQVLTRRV
jgi:hypothetical protein